MGYATVTSKLPWAVGEIVPNISILNVALLYSVSSRYEAGSDSPIETENKIKTDIEVVRSLS